MKPKAAVPPVPVAPQPVPAPASVVQPPPIPTAEHGGHKPGSAAGTVVPPAKAPAEITKHEVQGKHHEPSQRGPGYKPFVSWECQVCGRGHTVYEAGEVRCTCGAVHIVL